VIKAVMGVKTTDNLGISVDASHAQMIFLFGSKVHKLALAHVVLDFMKAQRETAVLAILLV